MSIINLNIEDVFTLENGDLAFALAIPDLALREKWKELSIMELKDFLTDKRIKVLGKVINLELEVLDVMVTSSIASYKLLFISVKRNSKTEKIQILDQVCVEM